jgi:hypothetical protein
LLFRTINEKDWDRIAKVTQTPLSLRKSINQSKLPTRQTRPNLRNRVRTSLFAANPDQQQQRLATATAAAIDATDKLLIRSQETFTSANGAATIADDSTPIRQIAMSATIEQQYSPELSQQPKPVQPSSILKTDKHRSRLPSECNSWFSCIKENLKIYCAFSHKTTSSVCPVALHDGTNSFPI